MRCMVVGVKDRDEVISGKPNGKIFSSVGFGIYIFALSTTRELHCGYWLRERSKTDWICIDNVQLILK